MKVRVTFDIDDTTRIAINVAQGNGFKPAPREAIETFLRDATNRKVDLLRRMFAAATLELTEGLDIENTEAVNQ